jgi:uncharacterized protein (TIGR02145 family)
MRHTTPTAIGVLSLMMAFSCARDGSFSDAQGNVYHTVKIGRQQWMAENLLLDIGQGCYCYDNDPQLCDEMGRLYTWPAAREAAQRIAGWHLPSRAEWKELIKHCGEDSVAYDTIVSEAIGFNPQWSGVRTSTGKFKARESQTVNYWSSSTADTNSTLAYSVAIMSNVRIISPHNYPKANACSVRLIRDD